MALTDVTHDAQDFVPAVEVEEVELYHPKTWLGKYVFSQDAKIIALQYSITAMAVGLLALVLSLLMRIQLAWPGALSFITPDAYIQFVTMHGMIMVIYLLTALFLGGFGNYLIPLMLGARDMVFPYVNMISYWVYLFAVLLLLASFFTPGGPTGSGWTLYPPQAILPGTPGSGWGISLMLISLVFFVIGFTMGGLNYVVTVLQARTRGMTLMRMPLTIWAIFTATVLALLAFPALLVSCIMMSLDNLLGTSYFMPAIVSLGQQLDYSGGSPVLFQHLFWFFGHPEVYIVALPAFGMVSDLLSVHARKNIFGYRLMVWAIVVIGGLSFVVWAHHMYVSGMNPYFGFFFATTTLIIAVPTAIKVYNWVLTLWRGNIRLTVPMLYAIGFVFTFINGGLTGIFLGNVIVDVPLSDTYFVVAHFHMVMAVSPILAVFGAVYHWYPKITGRMMSERLGILHFLIGFISYNGVFWPMHKLGLLGMTRRHHTYYIRADEYSDIIGTLPPEAAQWNYFITVCAFIFFLSNLIMVYNIIASWLNGRKAPADPWGGWSFEWMVSSPPPTPSFAEIPTLLNANPDHEPGRLTGMLERIMTPDPGDEGEEARH